MPRFTDIACLSDIPNDTAEMNKPSPTRSCVVCMLSLAIYDLYSTMHFGQHPAPGWFAKEPAVRSRGANLFLAVCNLLAT